MNLTSLPERIVLPARASEARSASSQLTDDLDPRRCVVLVPVGSTIEPRCEEGLRALQSRGYAVWRTPGFSAIDVGRSQMATDALDAGFEELMWIDSDIAFDPADVEMLRSHRLPLVAGLYAKKSKREMACAFLPGTDAVPLGREGRLMEIRYAGFGFVLTRRDVYRTLESTLDLPRCNQRFGNGMVPFFAPLMIEDELGKWYLAEDYSFCERARRCGVPIMVDATIRLWHIGSYGFGWEDAGTEKERYAGYRFHLGK